MNAYVYLITTASSVGTAVSAILVIALIFIYLSKKFNKNSSSNKLPMSTLVIVALPIITIFLMLVLSLTPLGNYSFEYYTNSPKGVCEGCIGLPAPSISYIGIVNLIGLTTATITSIVAVVYFIVFINKLRNKNITSKLNL